MMKQKTFVILLAAVFLGLMMLVMFVEESPSVFSSLMAFPFEQIGAGLGALSLCGKVGNGVALMLCAALALTPVCFAFYNKGGKSSFYEKAALCCLGVVAFLCLFAIINPSTIAPNMSDTAQKLAPIIKGMLGCTVWSVMVLCLVLRLIRLFQSENTDTIVCYLKKALRCLCVVFAAAAALGCGGQLIKGVSSAAKAADGIMAALRFVADVLPYGLDIAITFCLIKLLDAFMDENKDDGAVVMCAKKLSKRCCVALGVTAVCGAAINVIQLLFAGLLSNIDINADIPVVSIVFILLILLFARFVAENKRLKQDNDLFI